MNKVFKIPILLFTAICCMQSSCKKDKTDDGLPPLTFEGKNTIGCKINGVPWTPKGISGGGVIIYPTSGGYYAVFNSPLIHIWIKTSDPSNEIDLFIKNSNSPNYLLPNKFLCNQNTNSLPFGSGEKQTYGLYRVNSKEYITDNSHTGWIEVIKSDSVNKIISGRFEFDVYNSSDGKVYKITEGRFDYTNH